MASRRESRAGHHSAQLGKALSHMLPSPLRPQHTPPLLEGQHSKRRHNGKRQGGMGHSASREVRKGRNIHDGFWEIEQCWTGGRTLRVVLYFKQQWEQSKASCWKGAHGAMRRLDRHPQGHGLAKKPWEAFTNQKHLSSRHWKYLGFFFSPSKNVLVTFSSFWMNRPYDVRSSALQLGGSRLWRAGL